MKGKRSPKVIPLKPRSQPGDDRPEREGDDVQIEYEEVISAPSWMRLGALGVFILIIAFFLLYPFIKEGKSDLVHLLLAMVFAMTAWFVQIFLSLKVSVTNKGIKFGFYIFSKEIPYGDVLDCMVIRYKWTDFIGWGIKRGSDGCTMYNVPGDQQIAVKIIVMDEEHKRKEYAFSAKRPQVICKKVQTHIYDMPDGAKTELARNKNTRSGIY